MAKFAGKHAVDAASIAAKITGKYDNLQCFDCAKELIKAFKRQGLRERKLKSRLEMDGLLVKHTRNLRYPKQESMWELRLME